MFLFSRVLPYATTQKNVGKKVWQDFQEFSKNYMEQFLHFIHAKSATSSPEQFKRKIVFPPSSYSEKMRWGRDWPKQLYVLFIVKAWDFTEMDFSKNMLFFKEIMIKTSKLRH